MIELALVTLTVGLVAGWVGQRSRFCSIGGLRDFLLARDTSLLLGVIALFAAAWFAFPLIELVTRAIAPAAAAAPVVSVPAPDPLAGQVEAWACTVEYAATGTWPAPSVAAIIFLGGLGLGVVSTVAGACPFRQHVLAGQGSRQARSYLVGFYVAAALFGFWSPLLLRLVAG
jgi:uncharacterized membrane protein YedE/YeeE